MTALGCDSFSEKMVTFWETENVGSRLVQKQQGELPGLYYIELDDQGERIFHYWRNAAAVKKCFEYPDSKNILDQLGEYNGIYLSGISLAVLTPTSRSLLIKRLSELANNGLSIYFDCNFRPHLWTSREQAREFYQQLFQISQIVFLTIEEAEVLFQESNQDLVHEQVRNLGAQESVLKNGGRPCSIAYQNKVIEVAAETVHEVIDTTAAGDSFSAVYLVARHFGCAPERAATLAHKTASYVISHKGSIAPIDKMVVTGKDIVKCIK